METTLILLKDGRNILVSDERIKNDWYYCFITNSILKNENLSTADYTNTHYPESWRKIIAGIENLPTLTYSDEVKEYLKTNHGWVDVESLAFDSCEPKQMEFIGVSESCIESFIKGFKTHQSITNKMFSLEDMYGLKDLLQKTSPLMFESATRGYIKSLQQPIQLKVEVEMEDVFKTNEESYIAEFGAKGNYYTHSKQPKITNNSILITKILMP